MHSCEYCCIIIYTLAEKQVYRDVNEKQEAQYGLL